VTWANADIEQARGRAERDRLPRLSLTRYTFPGLLAAAASAGVIVGDGWRSGTAWTPFAHLSGALLGSRTGAVLPTSVHAVIGLVVHTLLFVLWGICFTAVARSLRGGRLFIAALMLPAALWILARVMFPRALGAAELSVMSSAHAALYLATVAMALLLGTRLARYA
jgi:hypothetical protein